MFIGSLDMDVVFIIGKYNIFIFIIVIIIRLSGILCFKDIVDIYFIYCFYLNNNKGR